MRLQTEQDPERPNPTFIPVANQAAEWIAERTGGIAQSSIMEALANIPTTAHILGGAVIGADPSRGRRRRAASACSATRTCWSATARWSRRTSGVNPSLTITALAERAMSLVPPKGLEAFAGVADPGLAPSA